MNQSGTKDLITNGMRETQEKKNYNNIFRHGWKLYFIATIKQSYYYAY